jgi:hypothetical protein
MDELLKKDVGQEFPLLRYGCHAAGKRPRTQRHMAQLQMYLV